MNEQTPYSNIRIVLVNTSHPGNIGGVARAMKNMCLSRLYLVDPVEFPSGKARARASGALDILQQTVVVPDLEQAIADCALVFGASARLRAIPWPGMDVREAAATAVTTASEGNEVALVFGRENAGLTNEELARCHYLLHIPGNPDYNSLNLAAAVQVLAYELHMAALVTQRQPSPAASNDYPLATAEELEGLYAHLEQALIGIGFLDPANPRQLLRRLRRLFNRARLDRMELNILRGMLAAAEKRAAEQEND
jgi:tRNA (cytidine32/uridine32-2'-O)-methyltransferase